MKDDNKHPFAGTRALRCHRHLVVLGFCALAGCATVPTGTQPTEAASWVAPMASAETNGTTGQPAHAPAAAPDPPVAAPSPADAAKGYASGAGSPTQALDLAPEREVQDLWERIRHGWRMPDLQTPQVRELEQWHAAHPGHLQRATERARMVLFHIVEELERRDMPMELALLPFVESAFRTQAVSPARAAGIWQFTPGTGRQFSLKQSTLRDDRHDVLASTRAALDYLEQLYGRFGDWHLALAAYNWGEGSVGRAIQRNRLAGRGTAYTDLDMPMETRLYVPRLQAIKNLVNAPWRFGWQLPPTENHPFFRIVEIRRDIDVALAAHLAGVRLEEFRALNALQNRPVILAAATPRIVLPWDNALRFQNNLARHAGPLASWTTWIVPATMQPAEAARRTRMHEAALRNTNGMPRGRLLILRGSTLLVPRGGARADVGATVIERARISMAVPRAPSRSRKAPRPAVFRLPPGT